jgi:molybdate transport system substrate-binding protein
MKRILSIALVIAVITCFTGCNGNGSGATSPEPTVPGPAGTAEAPSTLETGSGNTDDLAGHTLLVFCGAGMTKPFQEIADVFQDQTGCKLEVTYANAGQIQSQINTAQEGDLFIAGSADELAPVKEVVSESKDLVKHIPVLAVQSGNPLGITCLADLANENVRVVLGDVESTPIGKIANKALTDTGILDQVNVVARTTTAPAIFTALTMDECDAIIVWKENITDDTVEIVETTDMDQYIKTIPAASLSYCDDTDALTAFLNFLDTDNARAIWTNYGYEIIK